MPVKLMMLLVGCIFWGGGVAASRAVFCGEVMSLSEVGQVIAVFIVMATFTIADLRFMPNLSPVVWFFMPLAVFLVYVALAVVIKGV